jgi:hypothetical protein
VLKEAGGHGRSNVLVRLIAVESHDHHPRGVLGSPHPQNDFHLVGVMATGCDANDFGRKIEQSGS